MAEDGGGVQWLLCGYNVRYLTLRDSEDLSSADSAERKAFEETWGKTTRGCSLSYGEDGREQAGQRFRHLIAALLAAVSVFSNL